MHHTLYPFADTFSNGSWFLLLWSLHAVAILSFVCLMLRMGIRSSRTRHLVWLYGLIAVAVFPLAAKISDQLPSSPVNTLISPATQTQTFANALPSAVASSVSKAETETFRDPDSALSWRQVLSNFSAFIFLIWLVGLVISLIRLGRSLLGFFNISRRAHLTTLDELACSELLPQQVISRRMRIGLSSEVPSPVIAGIFRPVVLLPLNIAEWTTIDDRISILRHETAHILYRDQYSNLFQSLLCSIFFFHPLVRYACRESNLERELACDACVLDSGVSPENYADSILKVVERSLVPGMIPGAAYFASRSKLERRIDMILARVNLLNVKSKRWQLFIPIAAFLLLTWLFVPQSPVTAQADRAQNLRASENSTDDGIRALGNEKAFDKLIAIVLSDSDRTLRWRALHQICEIEGDGSSEALIGLYDDVRDHDMKVALIQALGDRKSLEKLVNIASNETVAEFRQRALAKLTELEGDGSSSALLALYDASSDRSTRITIIDSLAERHEYQLVKEISSREPDRVLRNAAYQALISIEINSDSKDR
jgi:beta-lactamase regulating signal transducer with metallopeptidase domain